MSGKEILFLAHRLPFPPDRGDRIRSWHVLQGLAKIAPVHVVAPLDSEADRQHVASVENVAASVMTAVRTNSKAGAVFASFVGDSPASVALFALPQLKANVRALLAGGRIGTVYAFSGQMAAYVPDDWQGRFVMDFVDVDSAKFEEQGRASRGPMGWLLRREAKRLAAFETATARRADNSIFVSEAEAALFTARSGMSAQVMGNGIDLDRFVPHSRPALEDIVARVEDVRREHPNASIDSVSGPLGPGSRQIVFTGQMDYAPNIEAVTRFAQADVPRIRESIPEAAFVIVGRAPTAAVKALASPNVIVTGEVADTRPYLMGADIVVAPLTLARGVQNKVLEAMAMGKAVVLSPQAAQGIDAQDGRDFIVAAAPADAVIALLRDPARALAIGKAARARMEAAYSWDAQLAPLAGILGL